CPGDLQTGDCDDRNADVNPEAGGCDQGPCPRNDIVAKGKAPAAHILFWLFLLPVAATFRLRRNGR
ncbi:MAG: hypothetical protein D6812_07690, partial [Deltaproteobacteria bacterium]